MSIIVTQHVRLLDAAGTLVLDTTKANGYQLVTLSEGARVWRRSTAASRFVPGAAQTSATLDMTTGIAGWLVGGATDQQLRQRINALRTALEGFTWRFEVGINGITEVWDAWCADSAIGDAGAWEPFRLAAKMQLLTATFPRQPLPVSTTGL